MIFGALELWRVLEFWRVLGARYLFINIFALVLLLL